MKTCIVNTWQSLSPFSCAPSHLFCRRNSLLSKNNRTHWPTFILHTCKTPIIVHHLVECSSNPTTNQMAFPNQWQLIKSHTKQTRVPLHITRVTLTHKITFGTARVWEHNRRSTLPHECGLAKESLCAHCGMVHSTCSSHPDDGGSMFLRNASIHQQRHD